MPTKHNQRKLYVICRERKGTFVFYTANEGWTKNIHKAWLFENKRVQGFELKEFPKGTQVAMVLFVQTITIGGPYSLEQRSNTHER